MFNSPNPVEHLLKLDIIQMLVFLNTYPVRSLDTSKKFGI